jgi:hypothetical protein
MSGNVPYCPSQSGVQILTGYDSNGTETGTITFATPFKTGTEPFVFMQIENPFNRVYVYVTMMYGTPTAASFSYLKRFNIQSKATGENFCWLAIGESSEISSGNVPYCKGDTGVQILTGYNNVIIQTGSVTFNTSYPFSSGPKVFMSLVTGGASVFSIELKGSPTTTGFSYNKHYGNNGEASGESFYWLAIGNRTGATGNVPVCPQLSGPKIFYGKYTVNDDNAVITFPSAFTSIPVVLLTIQYGGSSNNVYSVTTTAVSTASFTFQKRYAQNQLASSEPIWWLAIGN